MKTLIHLLLLSILCLPGAFAQMPDCEKLYLLANGGIYSYDPSQPVSAVNPLLNSISLPVGSVGLGIGPILNNSSSFPTFYVAAANDYVYYNGTSWVSIGSSNASSRNIATGGSSVYFEVLAGNGLNPYNLQVRRFDGLYGTLLLSSIPSRAPVGDLVADCDDNFFVFDPADRVGYLKKYSAAGTLLQTYSVANPKGFAAGDGLGIIGNRLYYSVDQQNALATATIGANTVTVDTVLTVLPVNGYISDLATCPGLVHAPPGVSISSANNDVCRGTSVTVTAAVTSANPVVSYQWKVNGVPMGGNSNVLSYVPANGDRIVCLVSTTASCYFTATPSNELRMVVQDAPQASVTIRNTRNGFCAGLLAEFNATAVNAGTPSYQWYRNNQPVGGNSPVYQDNQLQQGDRVFAVVTPVGPCTRPEPVTSDTIRVVMTGSVVFPGININTTPPTTLCEGMSLTFVSNSVAGGTAPVYQWLKNGTVIPGAAGATYVDRGLQDGDTIRVALYSSEACPFTQPTYSNKMGVTVAPVLPTSVRISANPAGNSSPGQPIIFTATPVNGGSAPQYRWLVNGRQTPGSYGQVFTATNLASGDVVEAILLSSVPCPQSPMVYSNSITVQMNSTGMVRVGKGSVRIYPNPAIDYLVVSFLDAPTEASFQLFDALGKEVARKQQWTAKDQQISLTQLPSGVYTYTLVVDGQCYRGKVLKQ